MSTPMTVLTVSQLNKQVKSYLEQELGIVHVEGELSNLSKPSSGHFYFTLKDSSAQIRCVFFKNRHGDSIAKQLSDGLHVVASGRLSLYEARGDYQLIVEELSEAGLGALYQQFEALKLKLAAEGLFRQERKKPIPHMPQTIGVITSPSGAAIRDILSTLARRFPLAKVLVYPSEVQGQTASQQLIKALERANADKHCDVLILARGGGSIEDLWAFNHEQLARQIAASQIPVVSGVGHETDFTIADFVADYRAETPTAAATAVTPDAEELLFTLTHCIHRLRVAMNRIMGNCQLRLGHLTDKMASPKRAIITHWQTLDYSEKQLRNCMLQIIRHKSQHLRLCLTQLHAQNPQLEIAHTQQTLQQLQLRLSQQMELIIKNLRSNLTTYLATLHAVSPLATLDRGYAIATVDKKVLYSASEAKVGDSILVRLA
ncbi:MAG: exodeoxyribonuclease VII large subunit, partial [Legionella sp.]